MAWSTPRTWSTGDTLTAALMNDNSAQLTALHTGASGIASLATGDVITASSGSQLTRQATLNVSQGGTGAATHTTGNTLVGAGTGAITSVATLGVNKGGTGAATFTDGGILLGSGTNAITALGAAANGQIPIGDGATDPVLNEIDGTTNEIEITNGAGTIAVGIVTNPTLGGTNITGIPAAGIGSGTLALARGGTGAGSAAAAFAALSPLTTRGDLLYGSSGTVTGSRLAVGSASDVLSVTGDGLDVEWAAAGGGGFSEFMLAYNESAISCANTTMTPILCDAEKLDSDTMHDNASNQSRITFTTAGTYYIYMNALTSTANADWALYLLDGDGPVWLYREIRHVTNSKAQNMRVSAILTRSAASYISMQVWQNSGGAADIAAWTGAGSYSMPQTYMLAFRIA
jgi:hypothetical protein